MTVELLLSVLAWCTVTNIVILLIWLLFFMFAHDWIYNMHKKWFTLSLEKFDAIHYSLMGIFKISTIILFIVPYLVLRQLA